MVKQLEMFSYTKTEEIHEIEISKKSVYNQLNLYFFGEEEICLHDALWFYGFYSLCLIGFITLALIAF